MLLPIILKLSTLHPCFGQFWRSVSCNSPFTALELRAVEAWLVSPGADSVVLCSVGSISFQLQYMMSFIVSSFITPELSTLKTWLVRSAIDCKVTVDSHHAKRVVTRDAWPLVLVALSLPGMRKVWQPETHLLYWYVSSPRAVWASGGTLFVQLCGPLTILPSLRPSGTLRNRGQTGLRKSQIAK